MRVSNTVEKLLNSCFNTVFIFICFLPFNFVIMSLSSKKAVLIILFFLINSLFLFSKNRRLLGMIFLGMKFEKKYKNSQYLIYCLLYTMSFSTLFFWVFIPFDLFVFNLVFIQLPMVKTTNTTLHGYIAGKITTMKNIEKSHEGNF